MDSKIKQTLKSLCFSHGWSYAVFWSYHPINSMLLRFEEAYNDEESATLVDDMILHTHILGQGIIGEAALTGNHQWLFSDTLFQVCSHFFPLGITIAIIPVESRGVVQLGSTQKILESQEILQETRRPLQETSLKPYESVDLDTLFESLVPLRNCGTVPEGLSFNDIFTEDNPPSLLSPEIISDERPFVPSSHQDDLTQGDDFGFDILKSYSLDDLYQLLADSPEQIHCSSRDHHQETSLVIQGNDNDLFDILGINTEHSSSTTSSSSVCHERFVATPPKGGLFSEIISTSLSNNNTCISSLTNVQDYYSCINQSKRRKHEASSAHNSSFLMSHEERITPPLNFEPQRSTIWIGEDRLGNSKKPHEEVVKKKKRAKAGESRKPRPKDRQMIQDRIKELRGMIPNGSKCSIDTLLDLTIRHMVFMQSIAKYADKLKQTYEPKLVKEKERTWALEVSDDDESIVCPIIVEDLKPQGQMQIEMLCVENGEFLEIADVVRGFGLNILKGVMETRHGQVWAHFIVEAKANVTRLQLFYSLIHLFKQKQQNITL
ncbi:unnamed protein product [Cochlearia groenlandica]